LLCAAWPTGGIGQTYHQRGQVCWSGAPCPELKAQPSAEDSLPRKPQKKSSTKDARKADAKKAPPPKQVKTPAASVSRSSARTTAQAPAAAVAFYKYPSSYRGEAPPPMPPGAEKYPPGSQQPYLQVTQGVWYWPGASDFKMPKLPDFDPGIDPARVIGW
jgi:hypothetical protein